MFSKSPTNFSNTAQLLLVLCFIGLAVGILMLPSNPLERLPGQDDGVFLYGGQQVIAGGIPYVDFWDHKGPLIYYINALGLLLGSGSRWGVWFLEFLFLIFTAIGLYRISSPHWGAFYSLVVLCFWLYGMWKVGSYQHFHDSNYIESYGLLFNVWAVVFWLQSRRAYSPLNYLLIGVMAGLSFLLRPNNIGIHISIFAFQFMIGFREKKYRETLNSLGLLVLGMTVVVVSVLVWFWLIGALDRLFDSVIIYNADYSHKNFSISRASDALAHSMLVLNWLPLFFYLGLVGESVYLLYKQGEGFIYKNPLIFFLLLGFPVEVILSLLSGRFLLHYYINWTPYLALMAGAFAYITLHVLSPRTLHVLSVKKNFYLIPLIILLLAGTPSVIGFFQTTNRVLRDGGRVDAQSAVAEYINRMTQPGDTVLVWGNEVWINVLSNRKSPTKYSYQYALFMPRYTTREKVLSFLQELSTCPPVYVIEPVVDTDEILPLSLPRRTQVESKTQLPDGMDRVYDFFDKNYKFEREFNGVQVFVRTGNYDRNTNCSNR